MLPIHTGVAVGLFYSGGSHVDVIIWIIKYSPIFWDSVKAEMRAVVLRVLARRHTALVISHLMQFTVAQKPTR